MPSGKTFRQEYCLHFDLNGLSYYLFAYSILKDACPVMCWNGLEKMEMIVYKGVKN